MISPSSTVRNLPLWIKHCRKVRALAQRIIGGEVGIIEALLQMIGYESWLHARGADEFQSFHVVRSESTHLPVGKAREHWNATALKEKDVEIKAVEDRYRSRVIEAATKIRQKYEKENVLLKANKPE